MEEMCFYRFGPFVLCPVSRVLRRDGVPVPLFPQDVGVLLELVSAAGMVVTKAELMDRVWPHTFVQESSIAQAVALLRRALEGGPTTRGPDRYIVTVPRKGYRFVAQVVKATGGPPRVEETDDCQTSDDGLAAARRKRNNGKKQNEQMDSSRAGVVSASGIAGRLTPREAAVLEMIILGRTSKDIASKLGIKLKTVESHRGRICAKLGLRGSNALLRFALDQGFGDAPRPDVEARRPQSRTAAARYKITSFSRALK